jgi:hypothetical protein
MFRRSKIFELYVAIEDPLDRSNASSHRRGEGVVSCLLQSLAPRDDALQDNRVDQRFVNTITRCTYLVFALDLHIEKMSDEL